MLIVLEKQDSTLTDVVLVTTGHQVAKIDKVGRNGAAATVYFTAQGCDVNLVINRKDDDPFTGRKIGMSGAEGDREKAKSKINRTCAPLHGSNTEMSIGSYCCQGSR